MNLSSRQVELLRATFALLEPKARVAALAYYQRLLALNPALRAQLRRDLDGESDQLVALLRAATDLADRPRQLQAFLADPRHRCASYDAGGHEDDASREALLWSLATTLGPEFTLEARDAWLALHATLGELGRTAPWA